MEKKYLKAHCVSKDKWFVLELEGNQVVNFIALPRDKAKTVATEVEGTSFQTSPILRPCSSCGSRRVGCCDHAKRLGLCQAPYSYQCLYCREMRINLEAARRDELSPADVIDLDNIHVPKDRFGNPLGSKYDLVEDGTFQGEKVVVINLCRDSGVYPGIESPMNALRRKGFTPVLKDYVSPEELAFLLKDANQLWLISGRELRLTPMHLQHIRRFFEEGHGLYLLSDNAPYFADTNFISEPMFSVRASGDDAGDRVISVQKNDRGPGIRAGHPIAHGIINLYEGITISTISTTADVHPLITSSANKTVTAYYEKDGRRAMFDGGFTRLYFKWDTAGTDRLIVNCAAWLAGGKGAELPFT